LSSTKRKKAAIAARTRASPLSSSIGSIAAATASSTSERICSSSST
jgi:hypothetical protein